MVATGGVGDCLHRGIHCLVRVWLLLRLLTPRTAPTKVSGRVKQRHCGGWPSEKGLTGKVIMMGRWLLEQLCPPIDVLHPAAVGWYRYEWITRQSFSGVGIAGQWWRWRWWWRTKVGANGGRWRHSRVAGRADAGVGRDTVHWPGKGNKRV